MNVNPPQCRGQQGQALHPSTLDMRGQGSRATLGSQGAVGGSGNPEGQDRRWWDMGYLAGGGVPGAEVWGGAQRWCPALRVQSSGTVGLVLIEHNKAEDSAPGPASAPEPQGALRVGRLVPYSREPHWHLEPRGGGWCSAVPGETKSHGDIAKASGVPPELQPSTPSLLEDKN